MEWLTAQNINDWIDNYKKYLIKHQFVKDEPGYICKYSLYNYFILLFVFFNSSIYYETNNLILSFFINSWCLVRGYTIS